MFHNRNSSKDKKTIYNFENGDITIYERTGHATFFSPPPYCLVFFTARTAAEKRKILRELRYHQKTKRNCNVELYRLTDSRLFEENYIRQLKTHPDFRVNTMKHWYTFGFTTECKYEGINLGYDYLLDKETKQCKSCGKYVTICYPRECICKKIENIKKIQKCWRKYKAYRKLKEWTTDPRWIEYIYRPGSIGAKWQELRWINKTS